jgi:tRNA G18 (ribose-2'-O)-methylase SpoU
MSELADYYRLRDKDLLSGSVAIVEGHTLVRRMLGMGLVPRSLLCVSGQEESYAPLLPSGCPIYSMDHEEIRELIGYKFHRGVLAAVDRPTIRPLAAGRANITANLVLNLEGIQEGSNFGAIIRSARAFGVRQIITGPRTADPYSRKAIRASAAWVFDCQLFHNERGRQGLAGLSEAGYRLLAAESRINGARDLEDYRAEVPANRNLKEVLVLGHEYEGLQDDWLAAMDALLEIPMDGEVDSLNVAVAAGIFLHALSRRGSGGK